MRFGRNNLASIFPNRPQGRGNLRRHSACIYYVPTFMCMYVCVRVCVCMYVCMYARHSCIYICIYESMYGIHAYTYVYTKLCMHA